MSTTVPATAPDHPTVRAALRSPGLLRTEVLAGLVVALALIPEAISFSIIAGVDPRVGLFASFTMAVSIAFLGGRPAMISAATGAIALVIAPVARTYGLDYLIATVLLAGVLQVVLGLAGVARLMRFVPRSVMVGFVNALAILIFLAQVPHLVDVPLLVYPMVAVGIATIVLLPRVTRVIPSPLVAIVALTAFTLVGAVAVPDVGDEGELPESLPALVVPDVPWTLETLRIIAPYALAMALVGLLESLLTARLVDDVTDTRSDKRREAWGQGAANVITGFFGGMGGCAMIGQTMINVKTSGARTRLSTFLAGMFLLLLVVGAGDLVAQIPMAALVAVMIMVSVGTFDWHSIRLSTLRRMPRSETLVMVTTVVVVVLTHNLAVGVVAGVMVAMTLFARRVAHVTRVRRELVEDTRGGASARYTVTGDLFFASSSELDGHFDYAGDPERVVIDLSRSHVWDASTVAALDAITTAYARRGKRAEIVGLTTHSAERHQRLSGSMPPA
ncbi:SulP family inorganic anion transporter [Nocardioides coralli]|uniref:SulP family inorganic anion transporter n=1 Tax=Nocardioides coralli TaxID=2872154 RepID=UPI001CA40C9B|nr:SulP family inorganic anion transporter [Nocardioides coralli]QZY29962.1 SulP family inorganic anion transporter [Nocardioides coralli]